jgi:hypothetical protein
MFERETPIRIRELSLEKTKKEVFFAYFAVKYHF